MQKNFFFKIVLKCLFKDSRIIIATAGINELNFQPVRNLNVTSTTNTKDARGADEPATGGSTVQTITRAVSTNDPPARPQSAPSGERGALCDSTIALLLTTPGAKEVHGKHPNDVRVATTATQTDLEAPLKSILIAYWMAEEEVYRIGRRYYRETLV